MNKALFSEGIMRRMRQYSKAVSDNRHAGDVERERLSMLKNQDEITETVFHREMNEVNQKIEERRVSLAESLKQDLMETLSEMREIASREITRPVTQEMAATLQILGMLDDITPTQLSLYARDMSGCPLAMKRLQQIAASHDMRIHMDNPEDRLTAIDYLEGRLVDFLLGYTGDEDDSTSSSRALLPYFQPEEAYMGNAETLVDTERVNRTFWREFVGQSDPGLYDNPDGDTKPPKAQYFFSDVEALSAFIIKATSGLVGPMQEAAVNAILADCPEQYGAAYRCFKASGEKIDLNDTDIE